ncbi:MAG: hypothetical protein DSY43_06760, partial [Gammaproteobacteria bacterium]
GPPAGGLITLIKLGLNYKPKNITTQNNIEAQATTLILTEDKELDIVNIYNRPCSGTTQHHLEHITKQLSHMHILTGDFNAHNPLWSDTDKKCAVGTQVQYWIETSNLVIHNQGQPTRIDPCRDSHSALDLTVTSTNISTQTMWHVHDDSWGSDHLPIFIDIQQKPQIEEPTDHKPTWSYNKADWQEYIKLATHIKAEQIIHSDINTFNKQLTDTIIKLANSTIPKTKPQNKPSVPWWNKDIQIKRKKRKTLLNKARRNPHLLPAYRAARNEVTSAIKQAKTKSWRTFTSTLNSRSTSKHIWNQIGKIQGKKNRLPIPKLGHNTNNYEKANIIAKHFAQTSSNANYPPDFQQKIAQTIPPPKQLPRDDLEYNKPFNLQELNLAIANKKGTATGLDQTGYPLIKNLPTHLQQVLLTLYNNIWTTGKIPEVWKEALVLPILKAKQPTNEAKSYRPISLTSNLCKTLETMVNNRLTHHLETNQKLSLDQSGFRKSHSTTDHLVRLEHDIKTAQALGHSTIAIFIDFSKAFDMVWHNGLLKKMQNMDIHGNMVNFIQNFLTDRKLRVGLGTTHSDTYNLENGTPQGSVISPTLFNIMIDDIFQNKQKQVSTAKYADDATLWTSSRNIKTAAKRIQTTLKTTQTWANKWGFIINTNKTVGVIFRRYRSRLLSAPNLYLNNLKVQFQSQAKFLGVTFDQYLTWAPHVADITKRCDRDINVIRATMGTDWGADQNTALQIYKALIRSKLEYGCQAFHSLSPTLDKKLTSIQYKALKIATGTTSGTSLNSLLAITGEIPLSLRREQLTLQYWASRAHNPIVAQTWQSIQNLKPGLNRALINRANPPFGKRVITLIHKHKLNKITPPKHPLHETLPPASLPTPITDTHLSTLTSKTDMPHIIKNTALQYIQDRHATEIQIYTDGSKEPTTGKTSFAVHIQKPTRQTLKSRLTDHHSVYTTELVAIEKALQATLLLNKPTATIFTDSLSSVQAIQRQNIAHNPIIITKILKQNKLILDQGNKVTIVWIPAHVGIHGNESADLAAKQALSHQVVNTTINLNVHEIKSLITCAIKETWQTSWGQSTTGKFLHAITPHPPLQTKHTHPSRKVNSAINRLKVGRTQLNQHQAQLGIHKTPNCPHCPNPETIEHVLIHCSHYNEHRQILHEQLQLNKPKLILKDL